MTGAGNNNSITEQITDVVKQPAFIAGIGGACWVILMGFSIWLYWRRKKRKGLSNYAVTFQRVDGGLMSNGSRPGLLSTGDGSYPWLADSWPASSIPANGGNNGPNDLGNFNRGDVLPPVPGQGDKSATLLSDGAIYSSIDFTTKSSFNSPGQTMQTTPYATTQILHSNSIQELAVDLPDPQWKSSAQPKTDLSGIGYSLPDQNKCSNGGKAGKKKKSKSSSKPQKNNGSNWANVPLPPPPVQPLPGTEMDIYSLEQEHGYDSDGWCPPLPVQTYLHQGMEDELEEEDDRVPTPPVRGVASSPAVSFGQQSTATLTPSPQEEMQPMLQAHLDELTRAYQYDLAKQAWNIQGLHPPQTPVPPMGYISSTLLSSLEAAMPDEEDDEDEEGVEIARPLRGIEHTPGSSMDNLDSSVTGSMVNAWGSASDEDRKFSSNISSIVSSSNDSIFTNGSFAQAVLTAAGRGYLSSQRLQPSSPLSTDSSVMAAINQSQKQRPTKNHKGGRLEQVSIPHWRDGKTDDLPPPPDPPPGQVLKSYQSSCQRGTGGSSERKGSSLERNHIPNMEDMSSLQHYGRTSLERQQQPNEKIGSIEHQEDMWKLQHKPTLGSEEALVPYSKPSFPSPGGHSSSGTSSSKGSTGPRKCEISRGHQRNVSDLPDVGYMGINGLGHSTGEL